MGDVTDHCDPNHPACDELDEGLRLVPPHLHRGIRGYVLHGQPVGDFLTACFANDFGRAVERADEVSLAAILEITQFLYGYVPGNCWGSRDHVRAWQVKGGLLGSNEGATAQSASEGRGR